MLSLRFVILLAILGTVWSLWPLPQTISEIGSSKLTLKSSFHFTVVGQENQLASDRLNRGISRYEQLIAVPQLSRQSANNSISGCNILVSSVVDTDAEFASLTLGVDESYTLSIGSSGDCTITSATIWGALYAMETFTQLLIRDTSTSTVVCGSIPVTISDHSRFTHRGMLIDTSRHYLPMSELKRIVDTFPMSKFNVLHWHAVDAQSFPLNLPSAPQMAKGAYSPALVYTADDLKTMVSYAADRGVRVMFEVDVPGHASSWQYGEPSIMADCLKYYTNVNSKFICLFLSLIVLIFV